ncbi:MAG: acetate kinase [Pseudanabaenaceae cyanobacterium SKYGB_i_bin29]|nr:acetate kinase [Pseudanabaenaceae cyanobacterium SKYG29]MDW8420369.1 acetate kinase [Pseudanabaenaceae cyanobacterium SKYGB_i_bin29]
MGKPVKILVMNAGSSSHKACLYQLPDPTPCWQGVVDWTKELGQAVVTVKTNQGKWEQQLPAPDRASVLQDFLGTIWQGERRVLERAEEIRVVGHRVVHGGRVYQQPVVIDEQVKAAIREMSKFAPVHNPANLAGIELVEQVLPQVPQVAVFDTAFHSQMPLPAKVYPLPYRYFAQGIYRYGFHGISHQYVAGEAAKFLQRDLADLRLITCHLGNGCSLTAVRGGISVNTTMGFTPLAGVMMGTRSGDIDPGILIYLLREGMTAEDLDRLLNRESGLLGVSGVSNDLRAILSVENNDRAKLAYDIFIHRLRGAIGSLMADLGGLDALVFTAGIGENSYKVRADVCANWEFFGIKVNPDRNQSRPCPVDISAADSKVKVLVIPTQEDWAIAQACYEFVVKGVV